MQRLNISSRPVLMQGLIFGAILAAAELVTDFSARLVPDSSLLGTVALALNFIVGAIAGYRVARRVGRLSSGLLAGLLTGVVGSLLYSLVYLLILLPNLNTIVHDNQVYADQHHQNIHYTAGLVLQLFAGQTLYLVFIFTVLAVLGGLMGGSLGRRRFVSSSTTQGKQVEALMAQNEQETAVEPDPMPQEEQEEVDEPPTALQEDQETAVKPPSTPLQ
jgi:uncharacterized protein YneF (UPF0154 family)